MKKCIAAFIPLALAVLLTACGNKGPLVRPAPDASPPAESAD
jgi:predicted small lipoprotein YifL